MIDRILRPRAAAAERDDGEADVARCDGADIAGSLCGHRAHDRRLQQMGSTALHEICGAAEGRNHAAERFRSLAAVKRIIGPQQAFLIGSGNASRLQHLGSERQRDVEEPLLALAAGQEIDGAGDLQCVARGRGERLVHAGDQRRGPQSRAVGDLDQARRQLVGVT